MEKFIIILEKFMLPLITAILGFLGGCHFEKNKTRQTILKDNNGNVAGRDINNVPNKK